eukprot:m.341456 g.341456  ORF g.341456 m.341456 type:complete len:58 (-) comp20609_c0_seq10:425-598(-)
MSSFNSKKVEAAAGCQLNACHETLLSPEPHTTPWELYSANCSRRAASGSLPSCSRSF